ncbi:MAG: hypothetical protein ACT6Q8_16260 [Niveispirillum sp.]|uniref:hypothetical protein n=1 Tax=Niveispirillum sp. TaxID=1917217 RepID=UPI004035DD49
MLIALTAGSVIGVPMFGIFMLVALGLMEPEDDLLGVVYFMLASTVGYCLLISTSALAIGHFLLRAASRRWTWIDNFWGHIAVGAATGFLVSLPLIWLFPHFSVGGPLFVGPVCGGLTILAWAGTRAVHVFEGK